jgi:hypothetical protein
MREDGESYPCKLINMSLTEADLMLPSQPYIGETIVIYANNLGRIEGTVGSFFDGGVVLNVKTNSYRRDRLSEQLMWLLNKGKLNLPDGRRHERIVPVSPHTVLKTVDGQEHKVEVSDVSLSGASVIIANPPKVGEDIVLGKVPGKVVRHHQNGIGVQFSEAQDSRSLRRYF